MTKKLKYDSLGGIPQIKDENNEGIAAMSLPAHKDGTGKLLVERYNAYPELLFCLRELKSGLERGAITDTIGVIDSILKLAKPIDD